ncbi:hypothetical protein GCM10023078_37340 [Gibbsiella greigii]
MNEIHFFDPRQSRYCAFSNLHPRPLWLHGEIFASAEHAYLSAKARRPEVRRWLIAAPTPELAAIAGHGLPPEETAEGWPAWHVDFMRTVLQTKFDQAPDLRILLTSTGDARLVEWSPEDNPLARFWGEYQGEGANTLGNLLMALRAQFQQKP